MLGTDPSVTLGGLVLFHLGALDPLADGLIHHFGRPLNERQRVLRLLDFLFLLLAHARVRCQT